jgi:hypothetical protein
MEVIRKTCSYGSPDLTGFDSFFSGFFKNTVYGEKMRDLQHLKDRIYTDIETVAPKMLSHVWENRVSS